MSVYDDTWLEEGRGESRVGKFPPVERSWFDRDTMAAFVDTDRSPELSTSAVTI